MSDNKGRLSRFQDCGNSACGEKVDTAGVAAREETIIVSLDVLRNSRRDRERGIQSVIEPFAKCIVVTMVELSDQSHRLLPTAAIPLQIRARIYRMCKGRVVVLPKPQSLGTSIIRRAI
jgi:hypothetical protein